MGGILLNFLRYAALLWWRIDIVSFRCLRPELAAFCHRLLDRVLALVMAMAMTTTTMTASPDDPDLTATLGIDSAPGDISVGTVVSKDLLLPAACCCLVFSVGLLGGI